MYNLVELFSGIGSQAKALKNIEMDINVIGTCEWDIQAFCAYDAIHNSTKVPKKVLELSKDELLDELSKYTLSNNGKEAMDIKSLHAYPVEVLRKIYSAIIRSNNYVDINSLNGDELPNDIDILTYSFPCQDLSNVGAFHGYNKGIDKDSGSRSSLLWQVGRILSEMKDLNKDMPKYLLMENVPTLLSNRHKKNFDEWITDLSNLGYISKYYPLNAHDFGLPQNRPRLLMISVYVGDDEKKRKIVTDFLDKEPASIVQEYRNSKYYHKYEIKDMLRIDYSTKQDRNPNSGNLYFNSGIEGRSKFRYLPPRECLLFMGFTDKDYENIIKDNPNHHGTTLFPRDKIIRMAGNSIPVKLLEGIFLQIKKLDQLLSINPEDRL